MRIWKLTCNKLLETGYATVSSSMTPRYAKWSKYFLSKEKAFEEQKKKYEALAELVGAVDSFEFILEEIEVVE